MSQYRQFLLLICFGLMCCVDPACSIAQGRFAAANFQGLILGKSNTAAVMRRFGNPEDSFQDRRGFTWLYYRDIGPVPGKVEIVANSRTGVIDMVNVYPSESLLPEDVQKRFGRGFEIARYAFDTCLDNGGESPVYKSSTGNLEYLESPSRGIWMYLDHGRVSYIAYMSRPLGTQESQCGEKRGK